MSQPLNEHQAKVQTLARYVWDSDEDAQAFLKKPHALLGNQPPLDVARTAAGADRVMQVLNNLIYGLPA